MGSILPKKRLKTYCFFLADQSRKKKEESHYKFKLAKG
jgi:hypothetical protein